MRTSVAVAVLLAGASLAQVPDDRIEDAVDGRFKGPDGFSIEALGVCRIGPPDQVECWKPAGQPSEALSKRIHLALLASSQDLSFRIGKDYRYLVMRRPNSQVSTSYTLEGGNSPNSINLQQGSDEPTIELLRVTWEPESRPATVVATVQNLLPALTSKMSFTPGAKARLGGSEYTLGTPTLQKLTAEPQWSTGFMGDAKRWMIPVGVDAPPPRVGRYRTTPSLGVLDRDGKPIRFVDRKGEPVPAVKVLKEDPNAGNFSYMPRGAAAKYTPAIAVQTNASNDGALAYTTNVNPARIGGLQLQLNPVKQIRFSGFSLDPKP